MEKIQQTRVLAIVAIAIGVLSLAVTLMRSGGNSPSTTTATTRSGILDHIKASKELHVAYGNYQPYTIENPNNGEVTGYSADIIKQIAKELDCKIVWHKVNWDTMSADLKRGTFDVVADPIFETIPRAPEFAFSDPYTYFADGIVVVKADDTRFKALDDLDREGISVSVGQGQGSEALIKARFSKATIKPVAVGSDNTQIFSGVLTGRADAAVADAPNAEKFVKAHPTQVKAIGLNAPPAYIPAGFALAPGDREGAAFFSVTTRYMKSTGILQALAKKYNIPADPH